MEYIICIVAIMIFLLILKFIFGGKLSELKKYKENEELRELAEKLPHNEVLCRELLQKLGNQTVKIAQWKDEKIETSVYTVYNNTIRIGNIDTSYTRLQTIAHECLHSIQPKSLLMFNFIFSNLYYSYFIFITVFTVFGFIEYRLLQVFLLTLFGFIHYAIRNYLEQDAMTKAKYLAGEYLEEKEILAKGEKEKLIAEYEEINKLGIPMVSYMLLFNVLVKVLFYAVLAWIL